MKFSQLATLVLLSGIMVLSQACGKKKDDSSKVSGGNAVNRAGQTPTISNQVYTNQAVYVQGSDLDRMSKVFLSPMIDAQYIGSIAQNGVTISGYIEAINGTGQVLPGNSGINLVFTDSLVGQSDGNGGVNEPISITMSLTNGSIAGGNMNLEFRDEYGILRIQGQVTQATVTGTISFENFQLPPWGSPDSLRAGTLGTFQIPTGSFFRVQ